MKRILITMFYVFYLAQVHAQGKTHNFLIGYTTALDTYTTSPKGRLLIDSNNATVTGESRKMAVEATQGNISDENGNLIISTNGCWIADATGDTMQNGDSLNPNSFTDDYCHNPNTFAALPVIHGNIILPYPNDPNKYVLFHQTGTYAAFVPSTELYYSVIDLSLNGGLGAVNLKNQIILSDVIAWGITACKHANGRDWWIIAIKDNSTIVHKILLDSSGVSYQGTQNLGFPAPYPGNAGQPKFSPDGKKFVYSTGQGGSNPFHDIRLFNFDRCNGVFSALEYIAINDSSTGSGLAFSSDSKYLYHSSYQRIYQINTDTSNIAASMQVVAVNDGFYSPYFPLQTNFYLMYLAANGKIYISSSASVVDMHVINSPDSAGIACDVQQHSLHLPCYSFRSNVNHPNYYLGCDTTQTTCPCLTTGIQEHQQHDFKFSLSPNPTNGNIKLMYLLPQNTRGVFEVYDVTGKKVFSYNLPPWSTLQNFNLNFLGNGVYNCVITSANQRVSKKIAVIK